MLNMDKWVTPNHFKVGDFEKFEALTPDEEFDLIAPITVYFQADLCVKKAARVALRKLKSLKHPLVEGESVEELLETEPTGLVNRYNALIMAIVNDTAPDADAYIDEYGAFGFNIGDDSCALMGDKSGIFAFYLSAKLVRERFAG